MHALLPCHSLRGTDTAFSTYHALASPHQQDLRYDAHERCRDARQNVLPSLVQDPALEQKHQAPVVAERQPM